MAPAAAESVVFKWFEVTKTCPVGAVSERVFGGAFVRPYAFRLAVGRPFCVVLAFEDESRARFVLVRHKSRGWELPGGSVEEGESVLEAARREFWEETGRELVGASLAPRVEAQPWDHVVVGYVGPPVLPARADPSIVEWRLVGHVDEAGPLSFPNDPYDLLAGAAERPLFRPPGAGRSR